MPTADCSFTRYNDMVARTPYLSPGTSKPLAATLREDPTWNLAAENITRFFRRNHQIKSGCQAVLGILASVCVEAHLSHD